ncbi:hypothetical protein DFH08DRAFT_818887 [Mycena albidolilacea]|uniref:Uncharacterized protein n=1 Tax=Mycena albidolilacea TaxID=1033008 RepID=A0AAD6ZFU6_9AGAR|nr:hypothetical protein DFH08DRAFT_818887 [Mycena albidolilacea]
MDEGYPVDSESTSTESRLSPNAVNLGLRILPAPTSTGINTHSVAKYTSANESESALNAGAFFPQSKDFVITGGVFTSNTHIHNPTPPAPSNSSLDFTMIPFTAFRPLGDRGCVRRAVAERGRPEGNMLGRSELEVVEGSRLQILHAIFADRVMCKVPAYSGRLVPAHPSTYKSHYADSVLHMMLLSRPISPTWPGDEQFLRSTLKIDETIPTSPWWRFFIAGQAARMTKIRDDDGAMVGRGGRLGRRGLAAPTATDGGSTRQTLLGRPCRVRPSKRYISGCPFPYWPDWPSKEWQQEISQYADRYLRHPNLIQLFGTHEEFEDTRYYVQDVTRTELLSRRFFGDGTGRDRDPPRRRRRDGAHRDRDRRLPTKLSNSGTFLSGLSLLEPAEDCQMIASLLPYNYHGVCSSDFTKYATFSIPTHASVTPAAIYHHTSGTNLDSLSEIAYIPNGNLPDPLGRSYSQAGILRETFE